MPKKKKEKIFLGHSKFSSLLKKYTACRRTDPAQFKALDEAIRNPELDEFWNQVLQRNPPAFEGIVVFQPEPDRHPFDILAGAYYSAKSSLRYSIINRYHVATVNINHQHYKRALENFKPGIAKFHARNEQDKQSLASIKTQVAILEALDDLDVPENLDTVRDAFVIIKTEIEKIQMELLKELEAGMHHGDFKCYFRAQMLDLQRLSITRNAATDAVTLGSAQAIVDRIEKKASIVERQNPVLGSLLAAHTYYWLSVFYQRFVRILENASPILTQLPKKCSRNRLFQSEERVKISSLHAILQQREKTFFTLALVKAKAAGGLYASEDHTRPNTFNALRGQPLEASALLNFEERQYANIDQLTERLIQLFIRRYPREVTQLFREPIETAGDTDSASLSLSM